MSLLLTALLMLCGLGGAALSTMVRRKLEIVLALAVSTAIAAANPPMEAVPDARWIGSAAAAVAGVLVIRPNSRWIGAVGGGALAGLLGALLEMQGIPLTAGVLVAGMIPAISIFFSLRRAGFAPEALQQEAMLATATLGLLVAVIPEISFGWQSALALNRDVEGANVSNQIIAGWVLVLSAASVVLGGLYTLLRRR